MTAFLLVNYSNRVECIYLPWFGNDTWGSFNQLSIENKGKYWYLKTWTAGNAFFDDEVTYEKLDVIFESEQLTDMLSFVEEHYPKDFETIEASLLAQLEEFNDFLKFCDHRC